MAVDSVPPGSANAVGGITAMHDELEQPTILVGPATEQQTNVIRPPVIPFACWKVDHMRFAFDSSVPQPELRAEIANLRFLITQHSKPLAPGLPARPPLLSVFGHADPTGDEHYNKILAGRRARSIYGLLTRNVDMWEHLFNDHDNTNDRWGDPAVSLMHRAVDEPGEPPSSAARRKALFLKYMNFLCKPADGSGDFVVDPHDFLGHGSAKGKADLQGCGEYNPLVLLSQNDEDTLPKGERNDRYRLDRRVVVLLFRPGTKVDPQRWPCPRAQEGIAGCQKRFYSDSTERLRRDPNEERKYADTHDTFACRFYDRMILRSPCERPLPGKGMGFLSVRVFFHARPMIGVFVEFLEVAGGQLGASLGDFVMTDESGRALFPTAVPIGVYAARVEYQEPKAIAAVFDPDEPEVLVLPIGRPYWCVDGDIEFGTASEE